MGPDCRVWCWQPAAGSSLTDVKAGNDFRGGQWIWLIISGLNSRSFQLRFLALQRCQQGAGGAPQGSRLILFLWCLHLAPRAVLVSPHSLRGPARAHSSSVWPTGPCFALVSILPYFLSYPSVVWVFEFRWGVTKLSLTLAARLPALCWVPRGAGPVPPGQMVASVFTGLACFLSLFSFLFE